MFSHHQQSGRARITRASLQLLQNCVMLINTILVERQKLWPRLKREDFRGLTPLFYNRINPYGTFSLDLNRRSFVDVA